MRWISCIISLLFLTNCVTVPVYMHDRHTVMEMESQASWPQLDKFYHLENIKKGSQALKNIEKSFKEKKAFTVLNGDFSNEEKKTDVK